MVLSELFEPLVREIRKLVEFQVEGVRERRRREHKLGAGDVKVRMPQVNASLRIY